jgi:hypothetical protein
LSSVTLFNQANLSLATGIKVKYDERPCHGGIADSLALAVTWRGLVDPKSGKMFPSQLQICPWFLDLVKISPYTAWQDVSKKSLFGLKVITKNEENKWGFRQIGESLIRYKAEDEVNMILIRCSQPVGQGAAA